MKPRVEFSSSEFVSKQSYILNKVTLLDTRYLNYMQKKKKNKN